MHVNTIDGLRAIAIISVLLVHAGMPGFSLGWLGVDLFFVLSGFLITSLLINEKRTKGHINIYKFMGRRILRLFPAYYFYISLITLAIYLDFGELRAVGPWEPSVIMASLWGYFNNFIPRGGFWEYDTLLIHLWSLSLEEQYYLIWPLLLIGILKIRNFLILPTLVMLILLILRYCGLDLDYDDKLHTRGIALFFGSYMALLCLQFKSLIVFFEKYQNLIFVLVMFFLLVASLCKFLGVMDNNMLRRTPIIFLDIVFSLMIASLWYGNSSFLSRLLSVSPLVYIGKVSYGIYLYHMFCHFIVWDIWYFEVALLPNYINYLIRLIIYISMSVGIAALSYRFLELPFLRFKNQCR